MQLYEMNWPQVDELPRDTPIVFPIAALEQHGRHMPLFTDSLLLGEVVRRASEQLVEGIVFAPLMWLGNSEHHLDFPGTMSAAPRTYLDLLKEMAGNFLHHGFDRIVFLNGHGGNIVPGQQALFEIRQRDRDWQNQLLLSTTYWDMAKPRAEEFEQPQMGHACEWETSMMLAIRPDLVGDYKNAETMPPGNPFPPAHRAWITKDRTTTGHIGIPSAASAEKGERLFSLFAAGTVAFLQKVADWDGVSWDG
jgi:creatinine amidohydrolase